MIDLVVPLAIKVPLIADKPLYLWLGIVLGVLIIFQIGTGKGWIPIDFRAHRLNAILIAAVAAVHAFLALGVWFGWATL